jgi:TonB family protein
MRRFIKASIFGICFVVCCASALCAEAFFSLRQGADTGIPQTAAQAISGSGADFELKIDPAKGFLVRRKGTSEWLESSKLSVPVVVGFLDETTKIYVPSKAVKPPKAKHMEPPNYPESEKKAGESGRAVVHIIVDDQGAVRLPTVAASPSPEFAKASIDAVKKWTFEPARLNGQPVAMLVKIEMQFVTP